MDLVPTDEEAEMVATVDQYLAKRLSIPQLRERLPSGAMVDASSWSALAELGVFSLGLPETAGGAGGSIVEQALIFVPLGRHLAPVELIAAVVGAHVAHDADRADIRDEIMSGMARVALGLAAPGVAVGDEVAGTIIAFDRPGADYVLVVSADGRDVALASAERFDGGVVAPCLDPSTQMATIELTDAVATAARSVANAGGSAHLLGATLAAAMLTGVADAARDEGVAYAKEREQFGRPIGVYQAIKHPCADMAVRCEAATSLFHFAAVGVRDGRADAAFQVAAAKRLATQAAIENSRANVQIHGGMGYTWEHNAHLYLSRAHLLDHLFGDSYHQQVALLEFAPTIP